MPRFEKADATVTPMPDDPTCTCEMWVQGSLDEESRLWFDDAEIEIGLYEGSEGTCIRFASQDAAATYGMIERARDLGLTLVSFRRVRG